MDRVKIKERAKETIKGRIWTFIAPSLLVSLIAGLIGGILTANMLGTIENKKYNVSNIILFVIYFAFLIYLGIYR